MNIFIYSDESGVFDKYHNDIFVFGGLICLNARNAVGALRRYTPQFHIIVSSSERLGKLPAS